MNSSLSEIDQGVLKMNRVKLLFLMVGSLFLIPGCVAGQVWFNSPDLRSAAADLREFLGQKGETGAEEKITPPEAKFQPGDWVVADWSKDRTGVFRALVEAEERARLEGGNPEAFLALRAKGVHYLLGAGQRGAIYASARLQTQWEGTGENPLASQDAVFRGVPTFSVRIGGAGGPNGSSDFAQPFPDDYDWEDYARDLAHYGVNHTAGVIGGEVVPDSALAAWGIRKVLFVSANPFSESQLRTWRSSNRDELKPVENSRPQGGALDWGPCISSDFGKTAYRDWLTALTAQHRTASSLVFFFSDWGGTPGEECSPGTSSTSRVLEFLREIDSMARTVSPDVKIYFSTRGFSADDLQKIIADCPPRIGVYFEEPSSSLLDDPATGYDPCLAAKEYDPVFEEVFRSILELKPKDTIVAVDAGDSSWLVSPAIGLPLPYTSHRKLHRAADMGAQNLALAMGGLHPWVYSPAAEAVRELFWNREETSADLAARIAARDFGHLSSSVQPAWSHFEHAIDLMPSLSRAQRLHLFAGSGNDSITGMAGIQAPQDHPWSESIREAAPFLLENLPAVIESWRQGVAALQSAQDLLGDSPYEMAKRLRDSLFWSSFYLRLLESQSNLIRSLNLKKWSEEQDPTRDPWRQAFLPIYRDEAATVQGWGDLLDSAPYSRIRIEKEVTTPTAFSRKIDQKLSSLSNLLGE